MYYIIDNFEKKTPSKDIIVEKLDWHAEIL